MWDRADPHAHDRALATGAPFGVSADEAVAAVHDVLESTGEACPKCPPDC
jgi:hypothetical protein